MAADRPHHVMRLMRANGWLRSHAPEVDRLYGIPQRAEHHPEVDTGIHVELTLEVASELSADPRVRYAALVHDLGKGLTPAENWPRHHQHEELGVEPGLELGRRLGVPEDWQRLGMAVARFHLHAHRAMESSPRTLVRFFRGARFFEQPEIVEPFTLACEADARGRAGQQGRPYPQGERVRTAFAIANRVDTGDPKHLHEARIEAVRNAL
jgi:tRNA nucleotidyltransferase (CCA-adding enzyme)